MTYGCATSNVRAEITTRDLGDYMVDEVANDAEKARIEALFRKPVPWYNDPKTLRTFVMIGAIIGALLHLYFRYR